MRERREDRFQNNATDLRTLVLTITVSLFIAMMAFFIILNTFSVDSAAKLSTVKNSLSSSFGFLIAGQASQMTDSDGDGQLTKMENNTASTLRSVLPDLNFKSHRTPGGGQIIEASIAVDALDDQWTDVSSRLADLMVNRARGQRYSLQIIAEDGDKNAANIVRYAQDLLDADVPPANISIGYEDEGRNAVTLRFVLEGG